MAEPLDFPSRDSSTACKLKRSVEGPAGATESHWFWIGLEVPTLRVNGRVVGSEPPNRQIWVSYERTGLPLALADTVQDQKGMTIAQVELGPGPAHGFTQREDIDTALVRRLMNNTGGRSVLQAVDSVMRAMIKGPRTPLDSLALRRAREISEFLWKRRCATGVPS